MLPNWLSTDHRLSGARAPRNAFESNPERGAELPAFWCATPRVDIAPGNAFGLSWTTV
jgi:hypothetical protein